MFCHEDLFIQLLYGLNILNQQSVIDFQFIIDKIIGPIVECEE